MPGIRPVTWTVFTRMVGIRGHGSTTLGHTLPRVAVFVSELFGAIAMDAILIIIRNIAGFT